MKGEREWRIEECGSALEKRSTEEGRRRRVDAGAIVATAGRVSEAVS